MQSGAVGEEHEADLGGWGAAPRRINRRPVYLGFYALPLFPTAVTDHRLMTAAFKDFDDDTAFTWPLWDELSRLIRSTQLFSSPSSRVWTRKCYECVEFFHILMTAHKRAYPEVSALFLPLDRRTCRRCSSPSVFSLRIGRK
jgi:hypothetical protein